ncbi:hypothetical protein E4U12_001191 [Claviceps purpurea]|nr:hypothetical protein E4U12_001191 [Claviceps purpurea]
MALIMGQPNESDALCRRIQELEREVQEKDKALKQEKQRALQRNTDSTMSKEAVRGWHIRQETERPMQEQDRKMRHALERGVEVHKIEPRDTRRRRQRNLKREGHIRRRQRALQQARDRAIQRAENKEKQAQERARELQQERNRALVQASERMSALLQEKSRSMQLRLEGTQEALEKQRELRQQRDRVIQWAEERDKKARERDKKAQERDKQAQEKARALQQERDKLLRQAWQREKAVKQERDVALQRLQEIDPLLQPSTLGDFIKECHVSLFSKLTIEPNAGRGSDITTTNIRGKWQPEKVMQWTDFLSEQRLIFDNVCELFPSKLRAFPRPTTVRENGTKIVPIADEKTFERFIDVSTAEPVKNIIKQLQSVDKLGGVCRGDVGIDFVIHADHAKPLEIDTTPSRPIEPGPVRTRYCIYRNGTTSMASATSLYVWEPKRYGRQPRSEKWQPGRKA